MLIIGLTGSIAMGKSTISKMLKSLGGIIYDADMRSKHYLFSLTEIKEHFKDAVNNDKISTEKLAKIVFNNKEKLLLLEYIIYPYLHKEVQVLMKQYSSSNRIIVLDMPKLFEGGFAKYCEYVLVVDAPKRLQYQRIVRREKYSAEQIKDIIKNQMDNNDKIKLADFKIDTGLGRAYSMEQIKKIWRELNCVK